VALSLGLDKSLSRREKDRKAAQMLIDVGLGAAESTTTRQQIDRAGEKQRASSRGASRSRAIRKSFSLMSRQRSLDRKSGREIIELLSKIARQQDAPSCW